MARIVVLSILVLSVFLPGLCAAAELGFGPERRKNQFPEDFGYLLAPLPYSMPGIGEGFFHLGHFTNLFDTTSDVTVIGITGDAKGGIAVFDEIPLIDEHLYFRSEILNVDTVQINQYKTRGMDGDGNDYDLLDIISYQNRVAGVDLVYYDRRLKFSLGRNFEKGGVENIRDSNGNVILPFSPPYRFKSRSMFYSAALDLTDDYLDPRRGVRVGFNLIQAPRENANEAKFAVTEFNASWYLPLFQADTLVMNYFQSDAQVKKKGVTDPVAIQTELGLSCPPGDTVCQASVDAIVQDVANSRRYGTATPLGGDNRFRAYPQGRFSGAHVSFLGVEYRWNFVRDATPFNFFIWKDTHTGFQIAFFAEYATVSETWDTLWNETRYVVGTGVRLVTASGSVYRADLGVGDEGAELSLFFFYPW